MTATLVSFNVVDEFLEELEREHDYTRADSLMDDRRIARRIMRVTNLLQRVPMSPWQSVHVLATFATERRDGHGGWKAAELVQLREYAGNLYDLDEGTIAERSAATDERAKAIRSAVEQACERLELHVRGGTYEVAR